MAESAFTCRFPQIRASSSTTDVRLNPGVYSTVVTQLVSQKPIIALSLETRRRLPTVSSNGQECGHAAHFRALKVNDHSEAATCPSAPGSTNERSSSSGALTS
jgi:hypothetical protein